ncbi:glycosyltransferase family 2 protein [Altererythrobacter lutimaris]|uniref:Glycosyltransferase family 2 protein n=1 Tax=Altererythrobacter lutimaris TaxID=2743979 RepID=A0A850H618_9SPHN|nr:glycosyltransferase family 2 protein [Altererythrobacter lutimaris]NVE94587.1 glycosyltransferase family 2 protein [Altererythrobacter lutimaris]
MDLQQRDFSAFVGSDGERPDVTIVMPVLNEVDSLPHCIGNALEALARMRSELDLSGEIVIADNGSTDGSQALATELGARVVPVERRGYGAALIGGCEAAFGRYIVMGDCDGSYNFTEGVAMVAKLEEGYDVCMGNRFKGGIAPGAMPWKNKHIGNPGLTGVLNLFFRSGIGDAHCGLRAIRKEAFTELNLSGSGMEFASEMVIKAALTKQRMAEVPATLSPDLRDRPPHLRPLRDGWRHLRYLFMLSPTWVFGVPATMALAAATVIFAIGLMHALGILPGPSFFGTSWSIVAGFLATCGHLGLIMAVATHFHGVRSGYRLMRPVFKRNEKLMTLEFALLTGLGLCAVGAVGMAAVAYSWGQAGFIALDNPLPLILSATIGAIGLQTILGGFLLAIIGGNDNRLTPRGEEKTR